MAERPVKFVISVEGGAEGKSEFDALKEAQREVTGETRRLNTAQRDAATASTATAAAAVAQNVKLSSLGSTISQVGSLLGRVNPEWSRFGQTIGSVGAQIPALTGSLGPVAQAIAATTIAVDIGSQAWEMWTGRTVAAGEAAAVVKTQVDALTNSLIQQHNRQRLIAGAGALADLERVFVDADEQVVAMQEVYDDQRRRAEDRRIEAAGEIDALRAQMEQAIARSPGSEGLIRAAGHEARQIEELTRGVQQANDRVRNLGEALGRQREVTDQAEDALAAARSRPDPSQLAELDAGRPGAGGARRPGGASEDDQRRREAMEFSIRMKEQESAALMALEEEQHRRDVELTQQGAERKAIAHQARMDQIAAENAALVEAADLQRELERRAAEASEAQQELFDKIAADAERITGPIIDGLTDALVNVISGAEAAEDSFLNMLRGFLEMISQEAALQAAKEFAMAIASFASQDYTAGGLHLAAGVGFTAVAVAAGVGAAAMAPPTPVAPETSQDAGEGGGGGTNVYNINGTIISAAGSSDRARAGREVGALVDESVRRYGRA